MKSYKKSSVALFRAAAVTVVSIWLVDRAAVATAGTSTNTQGPVLQGTSDGSSNYANNNPEVTISFSGQTALKTFDESAAITELQPGTSIVLHDGVNGAPVTYSAPNDPDTNVNLASPNLTQPDLWEDQYGDPLTISTANETAAAIQVNSAIRLEWHAQGSVDGFYDLINDEVGYAQTSVQATANGTPLGPISNEALRTPSSSNNSSVNANIFTGSSQTLNGYVLSTSSSDVLDQTYNPAVYTQATGVNIQGGQNRIQFSVGEYPTEAVAYAGTPSPFATAGSAGYGLGNPALTTGGALTDLGTAGFRQQFQSVNILNESTAIDDPQTGTNYSSGPWNSAGTNNITSTAIAATAVTYSANPGTGLYRIDKSDAQWLQTTGRLANGALFNVVARTVDTGQRVVFALNTDIDPSWAVGSNDDGNSTSTTSANQQHTIGAGFRLDGKTSGSEAELTIAQSRMGVGALSVPEARAAKSNEPVRALNVDFNDSYDVNPSDDSTNFIDPSFSTIVSSASNRYQAVLISHYNSVKSPNQTALNEELTLQGINPATATAAQQQAAWAAIPSYDPAYAETDSTPANDPVTGIKGDTTGDVAAFISNIQNSVAVVSGGVGTLTASANNAGDGLLSLGFVPPSLLDWTRTTDGGPITPVTLTSDEQTQQANAQANYGPLFGTDGSNGANAETIGSGSTYADGNTSGVEPAVNGAIPITAKNTVVSGGVITSWTSASNGTLAPGGNYLFGNFNQNGVRDYSDVQQAVNAALSLYAVDSAHGGSASIYSGATNSTVVPSLVGNPGWQQDATNTKGDLITLGDYNGDGSFNGQDIYLLATGASLADSTASTTLTATVTNFSDVVRSTAAVLLKNTALNYVNNYLNTTSDTTGAAFLRQTGEAVLTGFGSNVPSGATDLHTTDPITGYEQFTYDPNGANAFNPNDVNRDGVVDFNDAVLVDQYYGQSYTNLTQTLAATQPTPVTGVTEAASLVAVQQIDGEAAIGSGDLSIENAALAQTGNANWYGYNTQKTGPGTIIWGRTAGSVQVYSGASLEISRGVVQDVGTVNPFVDNTGLSTNGNLVSVTVDKSATNTYGTLQFGPTITALNVTQPVPHLPTITIAPINVTNGGLVDVGANKLVIPFASPASDPVATVAAALTSGAANNGSQATWTGPGISSSVAALSLTDSVAFNGKTYTVGYLDGNNTYDAEYGTVSANTVVVKYTVAGDAFLENSVGFRDLLTVAQNYQKTGQDFAQGNFFYSPSGSVGFSDLLAVAQAYGESFNLSGGAQSGGGVLPLAFSSSVSAVPEPGSIALLAWGAGTLLARRRRRQ